MAHDGNRSDGNKHGKLKRSHQLQAIVDHALRKQFGPGYKSDVPKRESNVDGCYRWTSQVTHQEYGHFCEVGCYYSMMDCIMASEQNTAIIVDDPQSVTHRRKLLKFK